MDDFYDILSNMLNGGAEGRSRRGGVTNLVLRNPDYYGSDLHRRGMHGHHRPSFARQAPQRPPPHPLMAMTSNIPREHRWRGIESLLNINRSRFSPLFQRNRQPATSARRQSVGDVVSDRRWGTDVGENETVGSRLREVTAWMEHCLDASQSQPAASTLAGAPPESEGAAASTSASRSHMEESKDDIDSSAVLMPPAPEPSGPGAGLQRLRRMYNPGADPQRDGVNMQLPPNFETSASPEERADDIAAIHSVAATSATAADVIGNSSSSLSSTGGPTPQNDNAVDMADTEPDADTDAVADAVVDTDAISTSLPDCPSDVDDEVWAALPPDVRAEISATRRVSTVSTAADTAQTQGMSTEEASNITPIAPEPPADPTAMQVSVNADDDNAGVIQTETGTAVSADSTESPNAPVSEVNENEALVASLDGDLRQDVLLTAGPDFLASLPLSMQREAQELRRNMGRLGAGGNYMGEFGQDTGAGQEVGGYHGDGERESLGGSIVGAPVSGTSVLRSGARRVRSVMNRRRADTVGDGEDDDDRPTTVAPDPHVPRP